MNDDELRRLLTDLERPVPPDGSVAERVQERMHDAYARAGAAVGAPASDSAVGHDVIVGESFESGRPQRFRVVLAAAAAIAVLVAGLLVVSSREAGAPADVPGVPVPDLTDTSGPEVPIGLGSPEPLPFPGARFGPGVFETDLLGMPLRFSLDEELALVYARPGEVLVEYPGSTDVDFRVALFVRLGGWSTREEAPDIGFTGVGSIAPEDVDSWIADNDVIAERRPDTVVAGRPTRVVDVRVDPTSDNGFAGCPAEVRPCFWYYSVSSDVRPEPIRREVQAGPLGANARSRFFVVHVDGADPILVEVSATDVHLDWLDEFERTTLATLELGPDAGTD